MYFLFQDRLVTIYQIKKTFEEKHGDIFPQIVINFEFWGHLGKRYCDFNPSFVVFELFRVFSTLRPK